MLGKLRIEQADGGNIQTIEPDHRLVGGVAMVMPLAARRQHQIVLAHDRLFAIERGEGPVAFHHEAQRDWLWRWQGAISPGRISCRPA
jgi:hypothetical protein